MIINSGVGGQDRLPLTEQVIITSAHWSEETKLATVPADWAVAGMSATVAPDESSMQAFSDIAVQGVYLVQILNGYLVFKSGSGAVVDTSITMNIIASNDGRGVIVNTAVIQSDKGISTTITYSTTVSNNQATITGITPDFKWVIPPYDDGGHEITKLQGADSWTAGASIPNSAYVSELYLVNNIKTVGTYAFYSCSNLKKIYIGKQMTYIGDRITFGNCTALSEIEFERNRTDVLIIDTISNYSTFGGCTALQRLIIPANVKIAGMCFANCTGLKTIRFESSIAMSGYSSFPSCSAIEDCTFTSETPVSSVGDMLSSYSTSAPYSEGKYIFVPYDKLTTYTTATNWVSRAYYMNGIGKFTAGATLPTQTTDEGWNLTWYATKADLKAGTNPITTAPSEFDNEYGEIYCTKTAVA